jgi:hypothetical protein
MIVEIASIRCRIMVRLSGNAGRQVLFKLHGQGENALANADADARQIYADRRTIHYRRRVIPRIAIDHRRCGVIPAAAPIATAAAAPIAIAAAAPIAVVAPITPMLATPAIVMALIRARRHDERSEQQNGGDRKSCR